MVLIMVKTKITFTFYLIIELVCVSSTCNGKKCFDLSPNAEAYKITSPQFKALHWYYNQSYVRNYTGAL